MDQVYKTIGSPITHHVLNNHYPVNEKRNDLEIMDDCASRIAWYHDLGENVGLAAGYNHLIEVCGADDDEAIILCDPDVYPLTPKWGPALRTALRDHEIGIASLMFPTAKRELQERGFTEKTVHDVRLRIAKQACMNSICATTKRTLSLVNGMSEPKKYYGGFEGSMMVKLHGQGLQWAYLMDYGEDSHESVVSEEAYRTYKWEYAHKNSTNLGFKEWLEAKAK